MSGFTKAQLKTRITAWMEKASHFELDAIHRQIYPCDHSKTVNKDGSHYCPNCKTYPNCFGWWCPSSPDNHCHYYSETRNGTFFVTLQNCSEFKLEDDYDSRYESDDCCIFCNQPDERK